MADTQPTKLDAGIFFMGLVNEDRCYPAWRYHKFNVPTIVHDTAEDLAAQAKGYATANMPRTSVPYLHNFRWDLEDMTARQLVMFAHEEFEGVELPIDLGKEKLLLCIWQLMKEKPQSKEQIVLMAQTLKMNYDETLEQIKRHVGGKVQGVETETVTMEWEE